MLILDYYYYFLGPNLVFSFALSYNDFSKIFVIDLSFYLGLVLNKLIFYKNFYLSYI